MKRHQVPSVGFDEEGLFLLDQRLLPREQKYLCVKSAQEAVEAIRSMVVRGAPAIGVTAAFALAQEARRFRDLPARELLAQLEEAASALRQARPTAVNLAWAVNRVMAAAQEIGTAEGAAAMAGVVEAEAQAIYAENLEMDRAIARHALELIPAGARILTHCNAGALATAGFGTAVGAIVYAHEQGRDITVWVDETRPLLQGARLTAWELGQAGVPYRLITDNMAGYFMSRGEVDLVIVGADRIARNGDVANKIGTYSLAVLAAYHRIPFYVAAPRSTLDLSLTSGKDIVIEERAQEEVLALQGMPLAPAGASARNPAFDVTPAALVTAIVTDAGVLKPPLAAALAALE